MNPQASGTEIRQSPHIVAHEKDGAAFARNFPHFAKTLLLETRIPNSQHLVDDQDFRVQVGCYSKSQAHMHAAGIVLHRRVDKLLNFCKSHDFVEFSVNFRFFHPQNRTV